MYELFTRTIKKMVAAMIKFLPPDGVMWLPVIIEGRHNHMNSLNAYMRYVNYCTRRQITAAARVSVLLAIRTK